MKNIEIINFSLCILIIILHLFCLYILLFICNKDNYPYARSFLINISTFDVTLCVCHLLYFMLKSIVSNPVVDTWVSVMISGIAFPQYGCLILLNINRFLEVYWHMKYYMCAFYKYRRIICLSPWFLWLLWMVTIAPLHLKCGIALEAIIDWSHIKQDFIGHTCVLVSFVIAYTYLYSKFRKIKAGHRKRSLFRVNVFLPFLVVLTFLLCQTVPLLCYSISPERFTIMAVYIVNRFDALSNAAFYIALNPSIRRNIQRFPVFKHRRENIYFMRTTSRPHN